MKHKGSRKKKKYRTIAIGSNRWGVMVAHTSRGVFGKAGTKRKDIIYPKDVK